MSNSSYDEELDSERAYVAALYRQLDRARAAAESTLAGVLLDQSGSSPAARWQRDVRADTAAARLQGLRVADDGLCFGRIDYTAGGCAYVGRIALGDEAGRPVLTDWRAPAARPFYCATAASPEGVARRRHLATERRRILGFHDDVLDLAASGKDPDAALLAAVTAPRGGTMRDIVATIQTEQDEVIRHPSDGVLVVEGGPGTGKTAVALHRVAYLLYTHRERLARRGVLVVGPHPGFLRYIAAVLPSLGETAVVFATPGGLLPGLRTSAEDDPAIGRVKGSLAMVEVLATAVADRQRVPDEPVRIELDDITVPLDAETAGQARDRARATGLPHNQARPVFVDAVIEALTERAVRQVGAGWLDSGDSAAVFDTLAADLRDELAGNGMLRAELDLLWPELTPQRLLVDLLTDESRLDAASSTLDPEDRGMLRRAEGAAWTVSDVPLLDEAAELLGPATVGAGSARDETAYAQGVLEMLVPDDDEKAILHAIDLVGGRELLERQVERDHRSLADRAAADREWTYGHVVVDEAQDLSEMDWRVLMRRCPARSFTVVGDLAQRGSAAGARSWAAVLDPYVPARWSYRELAVSYRTPAEIMAVASDVLAQLDPAQRPPTSVRQEGSRPWARSVEEDRLAEAVRAAVDEETTALRGQGTLAVIAPDGLPLDVPATVLTPRTAKGLEFDAVLVVEPDRLLAAGERGAADLYVALTRSTRRLGVLHTRPLPDALRRLDRGGPVAVTGARTVRDRASRPPSASRRPGS